MKPNREPATSTSRTYFITSITAERKPLFRYQRWCELFLETLFHYRSAAFQLHEFVLMPDHFHLLITPADSLEKAVQLVKGGFSRQATLQLDAKFAVWQRSFSDHRIRDLDDYEKHKRYIRLNPVKEQLATSPAAYVFSSAHGSYPLDPVPQGLKPRIILSNVGTAEAVPFQRIKTARDVVTPSQTKKDQLTNATQE